MSETTPRLWSDFDGTAVALTKKTNPRNWFKYPLPGIKGYVDFLTGVASTGVEIAGVVSRRPDVYFRRLATARSITKLGFSELFNQSQIVHAGSEVAKGKFVAEQTKIAPIGMLEDKPHKLGGVLLGVLQGSEYPVFPHYPVVLGVVSHGQSQEYIERLAVQAQAMAKSDLEVNETGSAATIGLSIRSESVTLDVVQLQPYSEYAGREFGHTLLAAAA